MFEDDSVYTFEPTADLFARSHDDSVYTYDRSADLFARSHDDSSMEGVTESSTVGCPVADADMAEESNQETAMDLRTVIPETQVHGQKHAACNTTGGAVGPTHGHPRNSGYGQVLEIQADSNSNTRYMGQGKQTHHCTPNCAERTWRNLIKLETDCPHHKRANPPYYTRYVHVRASVICYCSKCGSKYVSKRTKLRSEEAAHGSMGETSHFLEDEKDERNRPRKAKKEYFYFTLLETVRTLYAVPKISSMLQEHGLTLSEDVPQVSRGETTTRELEQMEKSTGKNGLEELHRLPYYDPVSCRPVESMHAILVTGIKGPSWLFLAPKVNLIRGMTVDYMHGTLLGESKTIYSTGKSMPVSNTCALTLTMPEHMTSLSQQEFDSDMEEAIVRNSRLLEQLPALKAVLVQGDNQAVKGHLQRYGGTFTDAFNYGNNAKQAKEKANRQVSIVKRCSKALHTARLHHPDSDTDYFHEVDRLRQSIVDCVSGEHSKCSLELSCPEYPSNPDRRGPAPEIPGGGNLALNKADRDALQAMELVHIYLRVPSTSTRFTLGKLENNEETIWNTKQQAIAALTSHHRPSSPTEAGSGVIGDQATCKNIRGARRFRQDDVDDLERLTWAKECPGKKFNQMDEFLHHACEGHLIAALLQHLEMVPPSGNA
ncbi:hypothetical protein Bbelb_283950 [Branchiostoma belcheri]|nr:hypothetical protein Bbelb_283950 [Branchiostoma belcheri]